MTNCSKIEKIIKNSWLFALLFSVASCGINSNLMLKTAYGETASLDSLPIRPNEEYKIGLDDKVAVSLSVNNGINFFDADKLTNGGGGAKENGIQYTVRRDSTIEMPIIGSFKIAGLTVSQAENALEKNFAKDFKDPFVRINVTNQRVIVFPGDAGRAAVVYLANTNTTLMEVLASSGGISERGKANAIKLIRREGTSRKIYIIDLSTAEGLKYTDVIVQANDYIYIEPKARLAAETLRELTPVLSLFTTVLLAFSLFTAIK